MRWLGVFIFMAGLVLSFGASGMFGTSVLTEFARANVYENGLSKPFEIEIKDFSGPIGVAVEMQEGGEYVPGSPGAALTIIVENNGRAIWKSTQSWAADGQASPAGEKALLYKGGPSLITNPQNGRYKFTVNQGDVDAIALQKVDLILQASPLAKIPYASNLGTLLIWLGAALFVLGLRRRNRVDATAKPEPSKWGRGS